MCLPLEKSMLMKLRALQLTHAAEFGPMMASHWLQMWVAANKWALQGLPVMSQHWLYDKDQHRAIDGSHTSFIGSALAADEDRFRA